MLGQFGIADRGREQPRSGQAAYGAALTLSNVDVFNVPSKWLVTAKPMYTDVPIVMVADPTVVQVMPSVEL